MTDQDVRRFDIGLDDDSSFDPSKPSMTGASPLDALRAAITAEVVKPDLTLEVLTRPGMTVRFGTNVELDSIQRWRKASHDKSQPDNFNLLKFAQLVIANCAVALGVNGEEATDEQGDTIKFSSDLMMTWTGASRPLDAVRSLYDNDGHIVATAQEVMEAAGYGDEMQLADTDHPTKRS